MAREKPPYTGSVLTESVPREIPTWLGEKLRKLCPDQQAAEGPWESPAHNCANEIIAEARWAVEVLFSMEEDITKGEIRAECDDLLNTLKSAKDKLVAGERKWRNISPGLDRLLPLDLEPLGCADQMKICFGVVSTMVDHLESASSKIVRLPKADRPVQKEHWVAVELAIKVLRVLRYYGIPASQYASVHENCESMAVTILETVGNQIGLAKALTTWRDIIGEAKRLDPELAIRPE